MAKQATDHGGQFLHGSLYPYVQTEVRLWPTSTTTMLQKERDH